MASFTLCFVIVGLRRDFQNTSSICRKSYETDRDAIYLRGSIETTAELPRFAIVHLLDAFDPTFASALLCSVQRSVHIHSNISKHIFLGQLDLVVMVDEGLNLTGYEHPYIRYVSMNTDAIKNALAGKYDGWELATHFKLAAMNLEEYDKVVFVDLDVLVFSQLASILLDTTPPAMVPWGQYPNIDFNSGFHIFRPSHEMFQDAIHALEKIGPSQVAIEQLQNMSTLDAMVKNVPKDPSSLAGYRSDQEFLFAFYDIIPETRSKWGPIHSLAYRYNAAEGDIAHITKEFLTNSANHFGASAIYNGAHLHLFGGFGHDGRGHHTNQSPKEEGMFGLVATHMTPRKPWRESYFEDSEGKLFDAQDHLVNNTALTPQERCPQFIYQVEFWGSLIDSIMVAMTDTRYGYMWAADSIFEYIQKQQTVKQCFVPELKALLAVKENINTHVVNNCPDVSDCTNKHCQYRDVENLCIQPQPLPFLPLINNK